MRPLLCLGFRRRLALRRGQQPLRGIAGRVHAVETHFDEIGMRLVDVCYGQKLNEAVAAVRGRATDKISEVDKRIRIPNWYYFISDMKRGPKMLLTESHAQNDIVSNS